MALSLQQKSVYLILFNTTMISRSLGKTFDSRDRLKKFKGRVFKEIERLTDEIDKGVLVETNIVNSISKLSHEFNISFGQAQKPINVILKYHYYLSKILNNNIERALHCPLDSKIMKKIGVRGLSLAKMKKAKYFEIQRKIQGLIPSEARITYDIRWDKDNLDGAGIR